ncbi:Hypothetical predicted protein, partial [Paramuricea clavata]
VSINGFKALVQFIESPLFQSKHPGNHYIISKRISQDVVESFFSVQRQSCGGTNNMTAYTYGYNISSTLRSSTKLLSKKEPNVYNTDDIEFGHSEQKDSGLAKRKSVQNIIDRKLWPIHL